MSNKYIGAQLNGIENGQITSNDHVQQAKYLFVTTEIHTELGIITVTAVVYKRSMVPTENKQIKIQLNNVK